MVSFVLTFQIFPTGHYTYAVYCEWTLSLIGHQRMTVSSVTSKHHWLPIIWYCRIVIGIKNFELHTDASKFECDSMLVQYYKGEIRPIWCASLAFNPVEFRWYTVHQELFAIKWALDNCRPYVLRRRIKVVTDHASLQWLKSIKPQQSKTGTLVPCYGRIEFLHRTQTWC